MPLFQCCYTFALHWSGFSCKCNWSENGNILTQFGKQPTATNIINNMDNGSHNNNTTYNHTTAHEEQDNSQRKGEANIGQKADLNKSPVSRSSDNKEKGHDSVIRI